MKFDEKINRRRFLKKGLCWGLLAGFLPLWLRDRETRAGNNVRPTPARHWRKLAG